LGKLKELVNLMPRIKFSKKDNEKIKKAVIQSEKNTSGEIATAITKESYDYAVYELVFAIICGFIYFFIMLFFVGAVETKLQSMFWDYSVHYLLIFYGFSTFVIITIFYFLANVAAIDRLIVPRKVMIKKVNERAVRHFMDSGVYKTRDRTGILIFISLFERRVELLADTGISAKIPEENWENIVEGIISGIRKGKIIENLSKAILECGYRT
jgi:putative membrane protein